ncbi:hypothetical protein ACFZAR_39310 [Streptomyces sp. NPDC008222]|uniref:hypothetical protein n=1 Tax=Streptomyces sp. NPDC008222 TaxID=3364820 RepID=UPI0036EDCC59
MAAGSNAMRTQLMVLDRDREVTGLAGRLLWRDRRGRVRSWVPQLFARHADGTALLADCPGHPDAGGERARNAAEAVAQACADIGCSTHPQHARPTAAPHTNKPPPSVTSSRRSGPGRAFPRAAAR